MVRSEINLGIKKLLSVMQICMVLLVTVTSSSWGIQQENTIRSNCTFSKYLEDPDNRARYEATLAKVRSSYATVNNYDNAAMYGVIAKAGFGVDNGENLDSFSAGCLSCHDGNSASNVRSNVINKPDKKSIMKMMSAKHPIGMDYEKYSESNKNLKSLDEMGQNVNLVEGRVSCITCHDPHSPGQNHLTITKTGIDLCSACHNI
jgi:predicted CXXCH cytochrome family protein